MPYFVMKEKTILSYQSEGFRLQMKQKVIYTYHPQESYVIIFQVTKNRRVLDTTHSEFSARKLFTQQVQQNVLQLKIY